jgi:Protein of unknown function (DUF499)
MAIPNLTLRPEFRGAALRGTAIELATRSKTGATQISAADFLNITYPSYDLVKALQAVGPHQDRTVVLRGERGVGKSHLMAVLHHAGADPAATQAWFAHWAATLNRPDLATIALRPSIKVISEKLTSNSYKFLWDLLFANHPKGEFIRGKWEAEGKRQTNVPSDDLILELLQHQPVMLLLDEFQTWFDGQIETPSKPQRTWAFNFIQSLSEIAKHHPDLLVLVISVRNGKTDAYQQVHRVAPLEIDFASVESKADRRRLLLHRLFENRINVPAEDIGPAIAANLAEHLRLKEIAPTQHTRWRQDYLECWPFAPQLIQLLEDQILVATQAQDTRDLICILASLFKARGKKVPVLTAADFDIEDDAAGISALIDSVANDQHKTLRAKAVRNLEAVRDAVIDHAKVLPDLNDIMAALWVRSISVGNQPGADAHTLQVDCTRSAPVDDNLFAAELPAIVENSFNIHQQGSVYQFKEEENPRARVMATARNERQFSDGRDLQHLAKEIRYVFAGGDQVAKSWRVVALPRDWDTDPWSKLELNEQPSEWKDGRLPILVLPEQPDNLNAKLGAWLKAHLTERRNIPRYLLPRSEDGNIFLDPSLLVLARAVMTAAAWRNDGPEYGKLEREFRGQLHEAIRKRYDRFAILHRWNFNEPGSAIFSVEALKVQGDKVPAAIEIAIRDDLFEPEAFRDLVLRQANESVSVTKILKECQEARPAGEDCIPWLGETPMVEKIVRLCAQGLVAIENRGLELLQARPGESEDDAWGRMRGKLGTGAHLNETLVTLPHSAPATHGSGATTTAKTSGQPDLFPVVGDQPTTGPTGSPGGFNEGGQPFPIQPYGGPPTGDIFGGGGGPRKTYQSEKPTSALNLLSQIEKWGVNAGVRVANVNLTVNVATGAQLAALIKKLPADGVLWDLQLETEE